MTSEITRTVTCTSCGKELWQGLTNKEKYEAIADGQAEGILCADCILADIRSRQEEEDEK